MRINEVIVFCSLSFFVILFTSKGVAQEQVEENHNNNIKGIVSEYYINVHENRPIKYDWMMSVYSVENSDVSVVLTISDCGENLIGEHSFFYRKKEKYCVKSSTIPLIVKLKKGGDSHKLVPLSGNLNISIIEIRKKTAFLLFRIDGTFSSNEGKVDEQKMMKINLLVELDLNNDEYLMLIPREKLLEAGFKEEDLSKRSFQKSKKSTSKVELDISK